MRLHVCLEGQVAAVLDSSRSHTLLTYSDSWLAGAGAYPLSQSLPLIAKQLTGAPVVNFMWGLLPDNERTLDAWGRRFQVSARDPAALLAHVGEDCAGAVQFVREERLDEVLASATATPKVEWLDEQELERRIRHLTHDAGATRENALEGQFSLSGAQVKTALHFDRRRERWGIPRGRTPTTHILKPVANNFDGFAENEHFCLTLAGRMGLAAARTQWRPIGGIPTLIAERYDRLEIDGRWRRVHQEDCCQAFGINPASKYENEGGPGFAAIMGLLDTSSDPEADRDRMMSTACLIYLLAATDAHSKNFSLLYARGEHQPSMRLAPLYDMASAWPYPRQIIPQKMKLAMRIGKHYRMREIQGRHFMELARSCRYPASKLMANLRQLAEQLPDEALSLSKELRNTSIAHDLMDGLVKRVIAQCAATLRTLKSTSSG